MGVTARWLRTSAHRPHVLIAAVPGGTAVRLAAERAVRQRGWPAALSPADTDILLVAGSPGPVLANALDVLWAQVPAPRARVGAAAPGAVAAALQGALAELADLPTQRRRAAAAETDGAATGGTDSGGTEMGGMDSGGTDSGGMDSGGTEMEGMDSGGTEMDGMDMGGMDMPAGLPMADRGADRDGLSLDQLHVALGPLLAFWPAGLIVRATLQGDVVQQAEIGTTHGAAPAECFWDRPWLAAARGQRSPTGPAARLRAAAQLDSLGRLLAVAGWDQAALSANRLREDLLDPAAPPGLADAVRALAGQVRRSRSLQWLTAGLGTLDAELVAGLGVTGPAARAAGDVPARYRQWCTELEQAAGLFEDPGPLDPDQLTPARGAIAGPRPGSQALLAVLPRLLAGAEFAAARLIIASLDPDLEQLPAGPPEAAHAH